MSDQSLPYSFVSTDQRKPETDEERELIKQLHLLFMIYDVERLDRISISRAIIDALEAAREAQ